MAAKIFHPLLALIASATNRELARYIQYLKEENKILRARIPGQIHTKPSERERLLKFGKIIGKAVEELITIVSPSTFYRWLHQEDKKTEAKNPKGGQRKPREIRELVIQIAKTTGFGLTRIVGEMRKLGIKKISRQTIRNILKEAGMKPNPDRTSDTWDEFLKRHSVTLWGCDFFSVKAVTASGIETLFMLAFLNLKTREAVVSKSTAHPDSAWVVQQTEAFLDQTMNHEEKPSIVLHDLDTKFTKGFMAKFKEVGVRTNPLPKASPNLNGRCERFIETIKLEALRHFLIFGKRYLDYIVSEFCEYYNKRRAHMKREHLPSVREEPVEVVSLKMEQIEVKSYVAGLVKSFERKAA